MEHVNTNPCSIALFLFLRIQITKNKEKDIARQLSVYSVSVASNNSVFNFYACLLIVFVFLGEQST